jgi:hypothetical protein
MPKKKVSKFRGRVSTNARQQKQKSSKYGYLKLPQDVSMYKEKPGGKALLDIMPYEVTAKKHLDRNEEAEIAVPGELWYRSPFKIHRNVGNANDTIVCPTSFGKPCPICEYRAKRFKEGAEKEETDTMKASARNLYAVIPLDDDDYDEKIHIWDISQYLFQNLLNDELEEDDSYEVFPDLEEGLSLKIRFDSKTIGKSKPFAEASRIDFKERKDVYEEDILDDIPNLDDLLVQLTYKEIDAKFFEIEDEEDQEQEEEEEKSKRKRKVEQEEEEEKTRKRKKIEKEPEKKETKEKPKRTRKPKEEKKEESKCPFGYKFGVDTDEEDECAECPIWESCLDKKEENEE